MGVDEGYMIASTDGMIAMTTNHKYIGEGEEYYIEILDQIGQNAYGCVPYC